MSKIRGKDIGMVFQDPLSALTPVYTVGDQIIEAIQVHQSLDKAVARKRAVELLDVVGIPDSQAPGGRVPARVLRRYAPARDDRHGDRQRPEGHHRRRADHRARRDHPGAGPGGAQDRPGGHRRRHRDDHPRPRCDRRFRRPGAGHVRGQAGRGGPGGRGLLPAADAVHHRPARLDPPAGRGPVRGHGPPCPHPDRRQPAPDGRPGARLPLRAALPDRDRRVPHARSRS